MPYRIVTPEGGLLPTIVDEQGTSILDVDVREPVLGVGRYSTPVFTSPEVARRVLAMLNGDVPLDTLEELRAMWTGMVRYRNLALAADDFERAVLYRPDRPAAVTVSDEDRRQAAIQRLARLGLVDSAPDIVDAIAPILLGGER